MYVSTPKQPSPGGVMWELTSHSCNNFLEANHAYLPIYVHEASIPTHETMEFSIKNTLLVVLMKWYQHQWLCSVGIGNWIGLLLRNVRQLVFIFEKPHISISGLDLVDYSQCDSISTDETTCTATRRVTCQFMMVLYSRWDLV
jgi:hypothetical protein